jgi:hypothetical protein
MAGWLTLPRASTARCVVGRVTNYRGGSGGECGRDQSAKSRPLGDRMILRPRSAERRAGDRRSLNGTARAANGMFESPRAQYARTRSKCVGAWGCQAHNADGAVTTRAPSVPLLSKLAILQMKAPSQPYF